MNRADRRAVVFVVLGLVAVAGCGLSDGSEPVRRSSGATEILSSEAGTILFTRRRTDGKPALFTVAADGSGLRLFVTNASSPGVSQDG